MDVSESNLLGEAAPAIFQTSLFAFDSVRDFEEAVRQGRPYYTRGANPTVRLFETQVATLEGAEAARAFASGMAAVAATLFAFLRPGDRVVATAPVYAGTHALLTGLLAEFGVETAFVPATDTEGILRAIPGARLVYLESPASYTFELVDLEPVAAAARRAGAVSVIDATYTAGVLARPLAHGIDLVVHSASKYFSGHSDVIAGAVAGRRELVDRLKEPYMLLGAKLAPFEAWLLVRGLRTLELRLARHAENARRVAAFLKGHPAVRRVHWVEDDPLFARYLRSGAGLLSVELADAEAARRFADRLEHFRVGVSWGGFESLVLPLFAQPRVARAYRFPEGLVRLSVGLEPAEALLRDLERGLEES